MSDKIKHESFCIKNRQSLNFIEPILENWLDVCRQYRKQTGWDHIYWYNEMVNVSALSTAVWFAGGVAATEMQIGKKKGKSSSSYGRSDLWFMFNKHEFYVEAKHSKISLNYAKKWSDEFEETRIKAIRDILETKKGETVVAKYLAVSFFPFYITNTKVRHIRKDVQELLQLIQPDKMPDIKTNLYVNSKKQYHARCCATAWYFPKEKSTTKDGFNDYCPGVVMVIDRLVESK